MKENHNNKTERSDLLRYFNGEMTGRERNAFERRLHRDLFSGEAAEGFTEISGSQLKSDLDQLDKRIKTRTSGKRSHAFFRVAATVTVLLVISSVFILLNRKNKSADRAQIAMQSPAVNNQDSKKAAEQAAPVVAEQRNETPIDQNVTADSSRVPVQGKEVSAEVREEVAEPLIAEARDTTVRIQDEVQVQALTAAGQKEEAAAIPAMALTAGGALTKSALARKQMAADSVVAQPEQIVTIDYGSVQKGADVSASFTAPSPAGGKPAFENYITGNIRIPGSLPAGAKAEVVLNLLVRSSGIDSVSVVSSPGEAFSEEAVRLIKEGPAWNPAENNGIKIDDEIRVRIIFKK